MAVKRIETNEKWIQAVLPQLREKTLLGALPISWENVLIEKVYITDS